MPHAPGNKGSVTRGRSGSKGSVSYLNLLYAGIGDPEALYRVPLSITFTTPRARSANCNHGNQ